VPVVDSHYITALGVAFADIQEGKARFATLSDGNHEYQFDGFSVIVRADEPALAGTSRN
jgi:hypothetical protein